ncbi:hypothetical protein BGW80DRAFT_257584 [Lactifluus volemus]|nr:hypothetical protein BGW80DRAFT_257584 [Lactifluus volemus]
MARMDRWTRLFLAPLFLGHSVSTITTTVFTASVELIRSIQPTFGSQLWMNTHFKSMVLGEGECDIRSKLNFQWNATA